MLFVRLSSLLILTGTLLFSSSCSYNNEAELYPCDSVNVAYSKTVVPIIEQHCYSCHSDANRTLYGNGIGLEGYNKIKSLIDLGRVVGNIKHQPGFDAMPKGGPKLNDCDIAKIEAWVNKGAPND